jgi:hypothetical protein
MFNLISSVGNATARTSDSDSDGIAIMNKIIGNNCRGTLDDWIKYGAAINAAKHKARGKRGWLPMSGLNHINAHHINAARILFKKADQIKGHPEFSDEGEMTSASSFYKRLRSLDGVKKHRLHRIINATSKPAKPANLPMYYASISIPDMAKTLNEIAIASALIIDNERASNILIGVIDRLTAAALNGINNGDN